MVKPSAGILAFRHRDTGLEFLLVHPGGPYWQAKDDGAWSIPKGEFEVDEGPLAAALREFTEETGFIANDPLLLLTPLTQPSGKRVSAWAFEGDFNAAEMCSNTFEMEWPPHSGKRAEFPEIDRAGWFDAEKAKRKLQKGQVGFIDELIRLVGDSDVDTGEERT